MVGDRYLLSREGKGGRFSEPDQSNRYLRSSCSICSHAMFFRALQDMASKGFFVTLANFITAELMVLPATLGNLERAQ